MNKNNKISVIIVDEDQNKPYNFLLPKYLFYTLLGFLGVLILSSISSVILFGLLTQRTERVASLERRVKNLKVKGRKVKNIRKDLRRISKLRKKLETMIGFQEGRRLRREMKRGGAGLIALPFNNKAHNKEKKLKKEFAQWVKQQHKKERYIPIGLPVQGWITATFNQKKGFLKPHKGVDIAASKGSIVRATASGIIEEKGFRNSLGNYVVINHINKYKTIYGHLKTVQVEERQIVKKGSKLGLAGSTGRAHGPHVHYAVKFQEEFINPLKSMKANKTSRGQDSNV